MCCWHESIFGLSCPKHWHFYGIHRWWQCITLAACFGELTAGEEMEHSIYIDIDSFPQPYPAAPQIKKCVPLWRRIDKDLTYCLLLHFVLSLFTFKATSPWVMKELENYYEKVKISISSVFSVSFWVIMIPFNVLLDSSIDIIVTIL